MLELLFVVGRPPPFGDSQSFARRLGGAWGSASGSWTNPAPIVRASIEGLLRVRGVDQSYPSILHRNFGILLFGHYPLKALINQAHFFSEQSVDPKPWIVVISNRHDHNGAIWSHRSSRPTIHKRCTREGITPLFYEVSSKQGALRRLIEIAKSVGPIKGLILHWHGSENGLDPSPRDRLSAANDVPLKSDSAKKLDTEIFHPRLAVVAISCSTAKPGGTFEKTILSYPGEGRTLSGPTKPINGDLGKISHSPEGIITMRGRFHSGERFISTPLLVKEDLTSLSD